MKDGGAPLAILNTPCSLGAIVVVDELPEEPSFMATLRGFVRRPRLPPTRKDAPANNGCG